MISTKTNDDFMIHGHDGHDVMFVMVVMVAVKLVVRFDGPWFAPPLLHPTKLLVNLRGSGARQ